MNSSWFWRLLQKTVSFLEIKVMDEGIMPENLSFGTQSSPNTEISEAKKTDTVQKILKEYDTGLETLRYY